MDYELEIDTRHGVGPTTDVYHHGPVLSFMEGLHVCLRCGYTADNPRLFLHEECERDLNPINKTWGEYLEDSEWPESRDAPEGV